MCNVGYLLAFLGPMSFHGRWGVQAFTESVFLVLRNLLRTWKAATGNVGRNCRRLASYFVSVESSNYFLVKVFHKFVMQLSGIPSLFAWISHRQMSAGKARRNSCGRTRPLTSKFSPCAVRVNSPMAFKVRGVVRLQTDRLGRLQVHEVVGAWMIVFIPIRGYSLIPLFRHGSAVY